MGNITTLHKSFALLLLHFQTILIVLLRVQNIVEVGFQFYQIFPDHSHRLYLELGVQTLIKLPSLFQLLNHSKSSPDCLQVGIEYFPLLGQVHYLGVYPAPPALVGLLLQLRPQRLDYVLRVPVVQCQHNIPHK